MIRVLVVDDDPLVRAVLVEMLGTDDEFRVVDVAADGAAAVESVRRHPVDVVLMDIRMPGTDGVAATRAITALPSPPAVVVLTTFDLDEYVYGALAAGAAGFLLKDTEPAEILRAVRLTAGGAAMLSPSVTRTVIATFHRPDTGRRRLARERIATLTPRERQVLAGLAHGDSNARIAADLAMREATVKAHVTRILAALHATNRVQAALTARDADLP
ncbi:response regulator [Actinocatenispora rupis]|uniref:DNA-binding response regulator n=1 Tax=Actinocatenispora rupis TaxID=519421 RepID=A0A8J3J5Y3_9ACTN|nr:response regulator transcription factor [Actinocatenispora rupis]GID10767.1 DNA-binding response regulator [Actinocatenispora rupis]